MRVCAVVLAAGESKRMGQPKMLLPWGRSTVLETVLTALRAGSVSEILVVTGGAGPQVETLVGSKARIVHNPRFAHGEMLSSLQSGLSALDKDTSTALIALGDQPQIKEKTVRLILDEYKRTEAPLIVPSFQMRRGHPWLVASSLWNEILKMHSPESPREFLNRHSGEIHYIEVETPTILQDLDTPQDYSEAHP